MKRAVLALATLLAGCSGPPALPFLKPPESATPNAAGLVTLPCSAPTPHPARRTYCDLGRHYVTPTTRATTEAVARRIAAAFPGARLTFMDASGADGKKPFKPHLSHGDGRQIDFALFYLRDGHPLHHPPTVSGYGAYVAPRAGDPVMCVGAKAPFRNPDPTSPPWRLDEARTRAMVLGFVRDPHVRRVFLEPHLKRRLGLENEGKVRFQGCQAARHDDHLHVDFY